MLNSYRQCRSGAYSVALDGTLDLVVATLRSSVLRMVAADPLPRRVRNSGAEPVDRALAHRHAEAGHRDGQAEHDDRRLSKRERVEPGHGPAQTGGDPGREHDPGVATLGRQGGTGPAELGDR